MVEIQIGYFMEDQGQSQLLIGLIERVIHDMELPIDRIQHEERNAGGGHGIVLTKLREYLRSVEREREQLFDLLVTAIDGNCHGYQGRRNEIVEVVTKSGYRGTVVCAIPDPHIERWYLADTQALQRVLDAPVVPKLPPYKCERGRYKQALKEAIRQAGKETQLRGAEYGAQVAQNIDLYTVGRVDPAFKQFIDELKAGLTPYTTIKE